MADEMEHQGIGPEPKSSDYDDYDKFTAAIADYAVRKASVSPPPETPQERLERERWEWATDGQGNFKSLGHQLEIYAEMPEVPKGGPNPYNYAPDTEDQFKADLTAYRQGRAVVQALHEAQAEAQQPRLAPWPDDPHEGERRELTALSMEYGKQHIMCKDTGQTERARAWRERQMQVERALEKLPPTPQEEWVKAQEDARWEGLVKDRLLQPERPEDVEAEYWESERVMNDAAKACIERNFRAKTEIFLPREIGGNYGPVAACRPKNMMVLSLPEAVVREFKDALRMSGRGNPDSPASLDETLRKSWGILHKKGYSSVAERAVPAGEEDDEKEEAVDLNAMSFKEFEAYRNKQELEKRGERVMFPPRRGGR